MPPILFSLAKLREMSLMKLGSGPSVQGFIPLPAQCLRIFGTTKDGAGAALGGCTVHLFRTVDDVEMGIVVSDGSGNYEFRSASLSTQYYVLAYKPGSPDLAGTTLNTLIGS